MNPQTGEVLAMVSLPTYDNNLFARGISNADYQALAREPRQAAPQPRDPGALPARLDVQARDRHRRASPTARSRRPRELETQSFLTLGTTKFYDWNRRGLGPCDIYCGFGHSSDTYFFQVAGMLGIDRLGYWAQAVRLRQPDRDRPAGRGVRDRPDEPVEAGRARRADLPGRDLPGRDRPGLRRRDADPADQRLRRPGQRRQALPAAARARHRRARRRGRPSVRAQAHPRDGRRQRACSRRCARRRAPSSTLRHTYNLVDLPIMVAGKSGTAEFGTRDTQGPAARSTPGSSASCRRTRRDGDRSTKPPTRSSSSSPSPTTRGRRATWPPRSSSTTCSCTTGSRRTTGTSDLLERGNFYQSN